MEIRELSLEEALNLPKDLFPLLDSHLRLRTDEERKRVRYFGIEENSYEGKESIILGIFGLEEYCFDNESCYYLSPFEIISSHRHEGLGTSLMSFLCKMDKSIVLTCEFSLISFYEKFGFHVIEFIEDLKKFLMVRGILSI